KLAAVAAFVATARADRARRVDGQLAPHRLSPPSEWTVTIDKAPYEVVIADEDVTVNGVAVELAMEYTPGDRLIEAEIDGEAIGIRVVPTRTGLKMTTRGCIHDVQILPSRVASLSKHMIEKIPPDLSKYLICPMPGLLVALHVGEGDKVEAGQPL